MAEILQFPFARGMDEGADPKGLPAGTPLSLENCYLDKLGRAVKRPGLLAKVATILGGGSITAGERLVTRGDDLSVFDGEKLYTYSDTLAAWQAVDRPSPLTTRVRPLIDCTRSVRVVDIAIAGNLLVSFYETGTSGTQYLYVEVRKLDTGEIVKPAAYVATGSQPRIVMNAAGTTAFMFWATAAGEIYVGTMVMSTLTFATQTTLTIAAEPGTAFDAIVPSVSAADRIYIIFALAAGGSRTRIESFDTSGYASVNSVTVAGTTGLASCGIATDGTYVHTTYSANSIQRLTTHTMALGGGVGPTTIDATFGGHRGSFVAAHSATEILAGWARDDGVQTSGARLYTKLYSVAAHAATASSARVTYGVTAPSKPWSVNSRWYTCVSTFLFPYSGVDYSATPAASVIVLEIETAASLTGTTNGTHPHVATLENQTGWWFPSITTAKAAAAADGTVYVPTAFRNREPPHAWTTVAVGANLHAIKVSDPTWGRAAVVGRGAIGASAAPFWWDGATAMPYGFVSAPILLTTGAVAGGSMVVGTYKYLGPYGWRDANGMLHRSPVSPSKSATTAGANLSIQVDVSSSSVSSKQRASFTTGASSPCWAMLHRTTVGGSTYYSLMYEPQVNVLFNDPLADDMTLTDTVADAAIASGITLASQPQIYTAGGVLDDVCPPAAIDALTHRDRAWLLAADGHTLWASKAIGDDPTVAPGFNEALTLYFTSPMACIGVLDESIVVLGKSTIDVVSGEGPDNTGTGAWGRRGVQTDRGSTNPRSLATIPQGLVFQSTLGIEVLTRELAVEWIGEPVRDQLVTYPVVTSAVVVPDVHQVRISVETSDAASGRVLVFDYLRRVWSVWNYGFPVADAALIGGVYTVLRYNGVVYQDRASSARDGTTYVVMAATISVHPSGKQGWTRMKHAQVLGTRVTPHALTMKVKRDFASTYEYSKTFVSGSEVMQTSTLERARITPPFQKGQGFVVRIEDSAPDGDDTSDSGKGPILESLAVAVQRKEGLPRIAAAQRG